MILLSDANVLIDLGYVNGIGILPRIAETEVLDIVLLECEHPNQPGLIEEIKAAGIKVVTVETAWIAASNRYKNGLLSLQDRLNIHYAKEFERILLAGDKPIREMCRRESIDIRGSLWLVDEALNRGLVAPMELLRWLEVWPEKGRWLPKEETKRLEGKLRAAL
ncbi:MAG TPA: hypothetical protein VI298_01345 [Geobacteraceae bacterium]